MIKTRILMLVCVVSAWSFFACRQQPRQSAESSKIDYSDTTYWYFCGDESHKADVFYVYPTVSTISFADLMSTTPSNITWHISTKVAPSS